MDILLYNTYSIYLKLHLKSFRKFDILCQKLKTEQDLEKLKVLVEKIKILKIILIKKFPHLDFFVNHSISHNLPLKIRIEMKDIFKKITEIILKDIDLYNIVELFAINNSTENDFDLLKRLLRCKKLQNNIYINNLIDLIIYRYNDYFNIIKILFE